MAKPKQLWNVSGVLKSFTESAPEGETGTYHAVEPWTGPGTGEVEVLLDEDADRLMGSGFTDSDPNPQPEPKPKGKKAPVPEAPVKEGG